MSNIGRTVVVAIGAIVCIGGCVPIPYPAVTSTEQLPPPLAAPVSADQSIAFFSFGDTAKNVECVIRELKALDPPLRVVDSAALPEEFHNKNFADPEVQRVVAENNMAYAVTIVTTEKGGCDFNLLVTAGGRLDSHIYADIIEIPSGQDIGRVHVVSHGELVGVGVTGCMNNNFVWPSFGLIFLPIRFVCEEMAEALHRYFTSGS